LIVSGFFLPSARADNAPSFTFTIAGDYGGIKSGSNGQKVANGIAAQVPVPNFHIAVGDLGYNAQNPTNWCASFKSIYPSTGSGSLVLVAGNHDTWNGGSFTYVDNSTGLASASDTLTSESGQGFLDTASGYLRKESDTKGVINYLTTVKGYKLLYFMAIVYERLGSFFPCRKGISELSLSRIETELTNLVFNIPPTK
jgi:hypothetical protein